MRGICSRHGESVKIKELILKMITMSGFKIKDKKNPNEILR